MFKRKVQGYKTRLIIIAGLVASLVGVDPALAYDPKASQVKVDASGFNGNLATSDDDVQKVAQKVDDLAVTAAESDPVVKAINGIVKSNGTTISAAAAGTDYLAPADIGTTVQAYNSNLTTWAGKTAPSGTVVGTSDTQTLTNKKLGSLTTNGFVKTSGSDGTLSVDTSTYLTSEVDAVVGNEVTNATDATLTRSGSGTGGAPYTLGVNLGNANTWTGQQTFNTSAPIFGTTKAGSVYFAGASGLLSEDNQNFYWNDTSDTLKVRHTLGSEKVTNGGFTGSATGWTLGSGYAYSSNTVVHSSNGTATLNQNANAKIGEEYILTYTISALTVGSVTPSAGGVTGTAVSANGTYTERFVATATTNLAFTPTNTSRFTIDNVSMKQVSGGAVQTGELDLWQSASNSSPGTTRHILLDNNGSNTWIENRFNGTLKSAIGADASGGLNFYQNGGNGIAFYQSGSLYSYNFNSYFAHSGYIAITSHGQFGGSVGAGTGAFSTPTSTLQSAGGTALKVKRLAASGTLDNTATHWLLDATTAAACAGTPTYSCGYWTNSTDCGTNNSHGGCSWFIGYDCNVFNYQYGMGSCSGQSPCSADQSNCSGYDQSSCESNDDSYGGSCAWTDDMPTCVGLDYSTCNSYSMSGCTVNNFDCTTLNYNDSACTGHSGCTSTGNTCSSYTTTSSCNMDGHCSATVDGDCTALSDGGGDGTACATQPECSYDSGSGACTGFYFTACTGDNSTCSGTPFDNCSGNYSSYSCHGTYYTGNCSGTYGAACQGTSSCTGLTAYGSTSCGNEGGCSWSSVLNATLPNGDSYPDRTYIVENTSTSNQDVVLLPASTSSPTTTINGGSSYTLENTGDGAHLAYFKRMGECSEFVSSGTCTPTGCSPNNSNCSWDSMSNDCSGDASCDAADGTDSTTCTNISYFSSCSGQYIISRNWDVYVDKKVKATSYSSISYDNELIRADGTSGVLQGTGIIASDGGYISWQGTSPTARLHLPAGSTAASSAPLKFISGSVMTTPEAGAMEYNSGTLYFTNATPTRQTFAFLETQQTFSATQIFKHSSGSSVPLRIQEATTSPNVDLLRIEKGGGSTPYWVSIDKSGLFDYYGGIQTVDNGVPSELATADLTGQSAAKSATTIYAVPSTGAGMYRISWVATITTAATTSSVLGGTNGFQVIYTDANDSVVKTSVAGNSVTSAANTTGTSVSGSLVAYCKASTNLQYSFGYTSVGGTAMQYNLHVKVEAL